MHVASHACMYADQVSYVHPIHRLKYKQTAGITLVGSVAVAIYYANIND